MAAERKAAMFTQFARIAKALASPVRMELVDLLAQAERSVEDLARTAGLPVGNTSAQLRILHAAGLLATRRDGNRIYYRLAGEDVAALYRAIRDTAHARLPDARAASTAYLGGDAAEPADAMPVTREELLRRASAGDVLVLDVRPAEEYAAGHIPGAVSVPLADLPARLDTLPAGIEIVAYCRGAYCVLARNAVRVLADNGIPARHLEDGLLEWRLDGLPLEAALQFRQRAYKIPLPSSS
jgi:rhodanese-related sulfurtransferase/DNA-binding transcriptional ArsR family regulator